MTAPGVWVGDTTLCPSYWLFDSEGWSYFDDAKNYPIDFSDIFCPGEAKPDVDVRGLDTLETCKVVDW